MAWLPVVFLWHLEPRHTQVAVQDFSGGWLSEGTPFEGPLPSSVWETCLHPSRLPPQMGPTASLIAGGSSNTVVLWLIICPRHSSQRDRRSLIRLCEPPAPWSQCSGHTKDSTFPPQAFALAVLSTGPRSPPSCHPVLGLNATPQTTLTQWHPTPNPQSLPLSSTLSPSSPPRVPIKAGLSGQTLHPRRGQEWAWG